MLLGDWDAVAAEGLRILERHGEQPPGFLRIACAACEFVLASRGRTAAVDQLRRIETTAPSRAALRALGIGAEGRPHEALKLLAMASPIGDGRSIRFLAEAELLRQADRWDDCIRACQAIRERAPRTDWLAGPALADRLEGAHALATGDPRRAEALTANSAAVFRAIGANWEAGVSELDHAEALRTLGRHDEVAAVLDRAAPALQTAGARRELARLETLTAG
jgi:hypothetical protein